MPFSTTMSNGVVVVPCSLKPRTWKRSALAPPVHQLVDGALVAVEGEDDRPVGGEEVRRSRVSLMPCGWTAGGKRRHQVDDVDHAHLQLGDIVAQPPGRGDRLHRRDVARAGQHDIGLDRRRRCRPSPSIDAPRAQCSMASSMVRYCSWGCLSCTIRLT